MMQYPKYLCYIVLTWYGYITYLAALLCSFCKAKQIHPNVSAHLISQILTFQYSYPSSLLTQGQAVFSIKHLLFSLFYWRVEIFLIFLQNLLSFKCLRDFEPESKGAKIFYIFICKTSSIKTKPSHIYIEK